MQTGHRLTESANALPAAVSVSTGLFGRLHPIPVALGLSRCPEGRSLPPLARRAVIYGGYAGVAIKWHDRLVSFYTLHSDRLYRVDQTKEDGFQRLADRLVEVSEMWCERVLAGDTFRPNDFEPNLLR